MNKAKPFVLGAALGVSTMYFALQYHVVHSHDGFQIIPRTPRPAVGLAYSDIRGWSASQWTDRPELARALMAHGSSDLIAESVASTLADSVTEDSSTLDELRSFLKSSRESAGDASSTSPDDAPGRETDSDFDLFPTPIPADARTSAADPFRVATSGGDESPSTKSDSVPGSSAPPNRTTTAPPSRFSANEIREALSDDSPGRPPASVPASSVPGAIPRASTTAKAAAEMKNRLFGDAPASSSQPADPSRSPITGVPNGVPASAGSGPGRAPVPGSTARPATAAPAGSTPAAPESDSFFEEVTSTLESRAAAALNRAKETGPSTTAPGATGGTGTADAAAGFVRDRVNGLIPDGAKLPSAARSVIEKATGAVNPASGSGTTPPTASAGTSLEFDPFLE